MVGIFFIWLALSLVVLGRRAGSAEFLLLMVLGFMVITAAAWGFQRLRQRPGKALLIWVDGNGIAVQPAFRWRRRLSWSRFRRPNAHPAPRFLLPRAGPGRWRLRVGTTWPRLLKDRGIDVYIACSKREIALVRNAMRRLRLQAAMPPKPKSS